MVNKVVDLMHHDPMISEQHIRCCELSIKDENDIIEYRCRECYADGAFTDFTLQPETRALKGLEADQKTRYVLYCSCSDAPS